MTVTNSHLFPVTHTQVYLPEQLVLHIDEYTKQKQENNSYEGQNIVEIPSGLAVGTMVQMTSRGGAPIGGVIKWIGIVPAYQGYVAGVELVSNTKIINMQKK